MKSARLDRTPTSLARSNASSTSNDRMSNTRSYVTSHDFIQSTMDFDFAFASLVFLSPPVVAVEVANRSSSTVFSLPRVPVARPAFPFVVATATSVVVTTPTRLSSPSLALSGGGTSESDASSASRPRARFRRAPSNVSANLVIRPLASLRDEEHVYAPLVFVHLVVRSIVRSFVRLFGVVACKNLISPTTTPRTSRNPPREAPHRALSVDARRRSKRSLNIPPHRFPRRRRSRTRRRARRASRSSSASVPRNERASRCDHSRATLPRVASTNESLKDAGK